MNEPQNRYERARAFADANHSVHECVLPTAFTKNRPRDTSESYYGLSARAPFNAAGLHIQIDSVSPHFLIKLLLAERRFVRSVKLYFCEIKSLIIQGSKLCKIMEQIVATKGGRNNAVENSQKRSSKFAANVGIEIS